MTSLREARVLCVGAGGLGSPAALALVRAGVGKITIADDDVVDETNLHRQILFENEDIGCSKVVAAVARLRAVAERCGSPTHIEGLEGRFLPDNADSLARTHDVVLDGADNFATKFLVADACQLAGVPSVQAGVVRWSGWAFASVPRKTACLRCVFEDIPGDRVETCAEAGVIGPAVGVMGGIEALLTVRLIESGFERGAGELWSYRAKEGALRTSRVAARTACALCGAREIRDLDATRYLRGPSCAA